MDEYVPQWARDMSETLGRIDGKLDSHISSFASHVIADEKLSERISRIELGNARQRGAARVWGMVAGGLSSLLTAFITWRIEQHK